MTEKRPCGGAGGEIGSGGGPVLGVWGGGEGRGGGLKGMGRGGGLGVGALEGREGVGAEVGQVGGAEGVFGRVFSSAPLLFVPTFAPYPHFSPHSDTIAPLLSLLCPSQSPFLPHSPIPPRLLPP